MKNLKNFVAVIKAKIYYFEIEGAPYIKLSMSLHVEAISLCKFLTK